MDTLDGYSLGHYQILEEIGHGGMANVYRAVQASIGREVAIKVLPPHLMSDPTFLERFSREVKTIAMLEHPRILPVHDYGEFDGLPYIVMRLLKGGTLADRIKASGNTMTLNEAVRLTLQIAEGLDHAHKHNIIHRDFKPANALMDEEGNVYLADFGIAKVTGYTMQLTGSGIIGTPAYLAPEMGESGGTTHLVDIYALGVTLFEMLTGQLPFDDMTPVEMLMAHRSRPIPMVSEFRPELPAAIQRVINGAMAKDPFDRYQTAGLLALDLEKAALGPGAGSTRPAPAATRGQDDERSRVTEPASGFQEHPVLKLAFDPGFDGSVRTPTLAQALEPWPQQPPTLATLRQTLELAFTAGASQQDAGAVSPETQMQATKAIDQDKKTCPECGAVNPRRRRRCSECGAKLH